MAKTSERSTAKAREAVDQAAIRRCPRPWPTVTKAAFAKFDETVEVALRLGVDPKHADQMVRGTVILPHGLGGKAKRVLVVASGREAQGSRRRRAPTSWAATTW